MLKNYFKIALRGFLKNKLTFFINLFGLALGLWAAMLIGLWVKSELTMNRDFAEIDQVYRIMEHQSYGSEIFTTASTPGILARELKEVYPEVEYSACFTWTQSMVFANDQEKFTIRGFFAEPDYLQIMQYEILHGNRENLLTEKSSIVLTEDAAVTLFGKTDVIGESIYRKAASGDESYVVQAVLKAHPDNISNRFDFLLPFSVMFDDPVNSWMHDWGNNGPNTVVKLNKNADWQAFSASIEPFIKEKKEGSNVRLFAYPVKDLYLYGQFQDGIQQGGRVEYVKLFAIIGIFVLLIACINFMNLSTAKSQKRAKEVGVRKVVGAEKGALISQFISESLLLTFIASIFAILLVELTLPIFRELTGKNMSIPYGDGYFWLQYLMVILFTGLVAGSYPAFYLSATKVVSVFRSHTKSGKHVVYARKGLVLFQFILATVLIVSTVVVYQQISYALSKDLGYKKDQLMVVTLQGNLMANYEIFKNEISQNQDVLSVSRSDHSIMGRNSNTGDVQWEGKDPAFTALFEIMRVDYDFIETLGINLMNGEDFLREKGGDSIQGAIINKRAYELITDNNPDASAFTLWDQDRIITGVVEDFHFQSFRDNMEPVIMLLDPSFANQAYIRVGTGDIQNTIASIRGVGEQLNPDYPFQYSFMDENYARLYQEDIRIRDLAKYFSILTILISCLGLFGLSAHIAEQKTKEIGIRKVLGASTFAILNVINREFIIIVMLSIIFGSGIAYWLMQDWLNSYAYHIDFAWWFIPLTAVIILSIAYITVSIQALKAAGVNPVTSLKSE